ncbi:MAG: winged helix-turn-helix domain-containing protein [Candidatus Brocadiales bacterium]|nr:winged helix-turn-helix domain-containing protein [Candidatus Brocadiales bacterium]
MTPISTEDFIKKYRHINFKKMAQNESCPRVRERLLGIFNLMVGKNRIEAAAAVGRNPEWLRSWVLRYDDGGYDNLFDKPKSGPPKYLSQEQEHHLASEIMRLQDERDGGRITAKEIQAFVNKKYNVDYKFKSIYDLLERMGMSWVSSRSKHPLADEEQQRRFKQTFKARVAKISKNIAKKKE